MAGAPWVGFVLRVLDPRRSSGAPGRRRAGGMVSDARCAETGDHESDGISLTGDPFNFTDYRENEMGPHGVMFYSTDPTRGG